MAQRSAGVTDGRTLRQAVLVTIAGYLLSFGTPFASFYALPHLVDATSAARTSDNLLAHPGLFGAAIFAMLANFVGDVLSAWGLYVLLRPVSARGSLLVAWFRIVYTAVGLTAVTHLVTAHELLTEPGILAAIGLGARDVQVQVALASFQSQFAFSLVLFGLYLTMLAPLVYRSGFMPKWLAVVLALDGIGWVVVQAGPYLFPTVNVGFLFYTSFGELILLVWLIGWGTRLPRAQTTSPVSSP